MAVGIIIGSSFNEIVDSLVRDIFMPPISLLMAGTSFSDFVITLRDQVKDDAGRVIKEKVTLNIGLFIEQVINFVIIAFSLFLVIQMLHTLRKKMIKEEQEAKEKKEASQTALLTEIRDLLNKDKLMASYIFHSLFTISNIEHLLKGMVYII